MKRRTFDLLASVGALVVVAALVAAGFVFRANADFARDNVRQQLAAQKIHFPPASELSPEEREMPGVVKYAGQQVMTGDQARVYANEFIALHFEGIGGGKTYSELSAESRADPKNEEKAALVQTAFRAETLRGLLLSTFAFWQLGEKANQAALVFWLAATVLLVLAALGLQHYARTSKRTVMAF